MLLLLLLLLSPTAATAGDSFPDQVHPPLLPDDGPQYSGRVRVAATAHGWMSYWLMPATVSDPASSPIIVVLEGGPGYASQTQATNGCGPYTLAFDGSAVTRSVGPSWNTNATLLFLDQPLGVGYSTLAAGSPNTASSAENARLMMQVMQALWWGTDDDDKSGGHGGRSSSPLHLELAPDKTQGRPLHIFGHSYGGRTGPALATAWLQGAPPAMAGSLAGVILGNALVDVAYQVGSIPDFYWSNGLCSDADRAALAERASWVRQNVSLATDDALIAAGNTFYTILSDSFFLGGMGPSGGYNVWCDDMRCFQHRRFTFGAYFNSSAVKDSLNMPRNATYQYFLATLMNENADRAVSSLPNLERLLDAGVRVLVYNGVNDALFGVQGSRQALRALNYSRSAAFRGAELRAFGWGYPWTSRPGDFLLRGNFLSDAAAGQPGTALLTQASVFGVGHFANAGKLDYTRLLVLQWVANNTIQTPNTTTTAP